MKWRDSDQDEELISAVAEYLEIVENGGDAAEYLVSLGPRALEVQQIAGIESLIRVNIAAPEPSEIASRRNSLLKSITAEDRRRKQTGPKLTGMFAAAGIGLALGAGFASGAVPTESLNSLAENIPFIGVEASREETDGSKGGGPDSRVPGLVASPPVGNEDSSPIEGSSLEATQPALEINEGRPEPRRDPATRTPSNGVGSDGTPPGQGGENPGNGGGSGIGSDGTPPGQGGENPGNGGGSGVGSDGTPPGQGGENPGNGGSGVGSGGTPPGEGGENPGNGGGNGVGSDGTPPGEGGENPGDGDSGVGSDGTPPGQGGENPGNGVGSDGTPPGQGGENPGNGGGNGN